ncbi:hypothetical protein DL767_007250 [Monosporascus sp. MG133]|nr:hypothetical protein DL767_007250 [Monosporascus sp. MG133]
MQEEPVHPTLQAQPAPELARPVTAHLTAISQNHVGASSNTNPTIASTTNLDLLPPFPKSERATATGTPPPEYEECLGILPVVPAKGNLSTGAAFESMVITRLERLVAGQNRIEAAILALLTETDNDHAHRERVMAEAAEARRNADRCEEHARDILESIKNGTSFEESMVITRLERLEAGQNRIEAANPGMQQQLQTCNQTSSGRRFRSALVKGTRRSPPKSYRLKDKRYRLTASSMEVGSDPAHREMVMAEAAEARRRAAETRREADQCEEVARCILECLKNGTDFKETMEYKLYLPDFPRWLLTYLGITIGLR